MSPDPIRPAIFRSLEWLDCATSTRASYRPDEPRPHMAARILAQAAPPQTPCAIVHQVHGCRIRHIDRPGVPALWPEDVVPAPTEGVLLAGEADALATLVPGIALAIFTADCAPLVLLEPKARALAVVHAGRESTRQEIARRTVMHLARHGAQPGRMLAWIGPCICVEHYEVSAEAARPFQRAFGRCLGAVAGEEGRRLDLARINRLQLIEAGLAPDNIEQHEGCTLEDETLCSYRRDGDNAGRMMTWATMREGR